MAALLVVAALVPLAANAQPAAPAGLGAAASDEQAVLTWRDPSNDAIVRYEFRFGAGEAPEFNAWAEVPGSGADTVEHTVSGLANGTRYGFQVRAVDDDGAGEAANASTMLAASPSAAVEVPDAALRKAIEERLGLDSGAPITQGDLARLMGLRATNVGIADLDGLESAINLAVLQLPLNAIADVSALAGLTSLTHLNLNGNELSDVSALAGLASLTYLGLSGNELSDVSALAGLTSLRTLHLSGNELSDVSALAGLTSLTTLTLFSNELSDVSALAGLTSLTWLELYNNDVSDVSALAGLTSLTTLYLSGNELSDVSALAGLTSLTWLALTRNAISDVSALAGMTRLERLDLSGNEVSDVSVLSGLASLTELDLSGNDMLSEVSLSGLTSLTELDLSDNKIATLSLSGLTSLTELDLSGNDMLSEVSLSGLTSLTELDLSDNKIATLSLSGLTSLAKLDLSASKMAVLSLSGLTALVELDLSGSEVAEVQLSDLTSLRELNLSDNKIATLSLSGLTSLTELDLSDNKIATLSLSGLTSLTTLFLGGNELSGVSTLSGLTSLTELYLSGNKLSDVSTLSALSGLTSLMLLDLGRNEIADLSGLSALYGRTSLTDLRLYDNAITNVSPLSPLTSLTTLNLGSNQISDISALSDLTSLTYLSLESNKVTDVSALSALTSLTALWLTGNKIVDVSALSGLTSLTNLGLGDNGISDVSPLSGLTSLEGLHLWLNAISDVSALSGLMSLTTLGLSGNPISDLSALSGLTSLTTLRLWNTKTSDVSPLSSLTSLIELRLDVNEISDVSALSGLTSLRSLFLNHNAISDISYLGSLEELSTLVLRRNAIADISALVDSGLLGEYNYVDLRGNPLGDGQAEYVERLRESGTTVVFDDGGHRVPLFPSVSAAASPALGFVRVINHSEEAGSVIIEAVDETGERRGPESLAIEAGQVLHFNAQDLEEGNSAKGLRGVGEAVGDWRLVLRSELDIEVLGYARTPDGFVTSLHDLAPEGYFQWARVPTFNPGSNRRQVSRLRLTNPTDRIKSVWVQPRDDTGSRRRTTVIRAPAHQTLELTALQLESGEGDSLIGFFSNRAGFGDGSGKWRLDLYAPGVRVMSLLQSPTGHLANISTGTTLPQWDRTFISWQRGGRYRVQLFPAATGEIQGFLRIVNLYSASAAITLRAFDSGGVEREPAMLTLKGNEALHLNSEDLESGNAAKGLPGIGAATGDWHLEVSGNRRFEVLTYARTADGFVTSLHDVAPRLQDGSLWIPFFNPGSNRNQASRLRLVNWGETAAEATITGTDDAGNSPGEAVRVTVPARSARDYMAWELETGSAAGLSGALGDGAGKWRLRVSAPEDVEAMSLLGLPTGHVTNLSTTPRHPPE